MQSVKDPVSIKGSEMELSTKSLGDLFGEALSILFERYKEEKKREGTKRHSSMHLTGPMHKRYVLYVGQQNWSSKTLSASSIAAEIWNNLIIFLPLSLKYLS
jgi:hypothetical protein